MNDEQNTPAEETQEAPAVEIIEEHPATQEEVDLNPGEGLEVGDMVGTTQVELDAEKLPEDAPVAE